MEDTGTQGGGSSDDLAQNWESVRKSFRTSIMVDTSLKALAENVGTDKWPIPGKDESPSKYLDLTIEELHMLPELASKPERINLLVEILQETLAFDDPFGDMVDQVEASSKAEDNIVKNLRTLEIPTDFPIDLTSLSPETKQFCITEGLDTLGQFIEFSQNMAQNIVVGGDFRSFLNALAHVDEVGIARYLPFREARKGFHLAESVGHIVNARTDDEKLALRKEFGGVLTEEEENSRVKIASDRLTRIEDDMIGRLDRYMEWFKGGREDLEKRLSEGVTLERYFMTLDDPGVEVVAVNIMSKYLASKGVEVGRAAASKRGLFGRFSRMFRK